MGPCCLQANLEGYFQQGLVTGNYSALKLTSLGKTFSSPSRQQQLTSSGQNRKKEKWWQRKGPEKTVGVVTLCSLEGAFIFYFRESVENTQILVMAFINVANLPTSLHTRTTEFTLKEKSLGLWQRLRIRSCYYTSSQDCVRRKGSFTGPEWELNVKAI